LKQIDRQTLFAGHYFHAAADQDTFRSVEGLLDDATHSIFQLAHEKYLSPTFVHCRRKTCAIFRKYPCVLYIRRYHFAKYFEIHHLNLLLLLTLYLQQPGFRFQHVYVY